MSNIMDNLRELFQIEKWNTTSFHPAGNGALERSHNTLKEYLRIFANENKDWDAKIPFAMLAYNNTEHSSTKFTPQELVFGKSARFPSEFPTEEKVKTYDDYFRDLISKLNKSKTHTKAKRLRVR